MSHVLQEITIRRDATTMLLPFTDYFQGFEKVPAVRSLFGDKTEEVLRNLKVEFFSSRFGYMGLSDEDGHLLISTFHLKNSELRILYLDIIHELYHIKQFLEGKQLFSSKYTYVDNPIELEAYRYTVEEARRLGMSEEEIADYLKVEWINEEEHERLVRSLGIERVR